jgi:uncharacterized membrane protein
MANDEEPVKPPAAGDERPSSELVAERLATAQGDNDVALVHREMEIASAERLMFFSDAVVAIALTLLALELPVPGGIENVDSVSISDMISDAGRHLDDYLAFLISFLVIGAHWRIHHRAFRYVREATTPIIRLNMYWLLLIVITPFTTKTLSVGQQNLLRFGLYAGTRRCHSPSSQ